MNDLQQHFDSLLYDVEFTSYDNDKDRLERIKYLIPSLSVSEAQELLYKFEKYRDRLGSRKGAESFATSGFNRAVNGITGTLKSKPVMNTLKRTTGTKDQRNQVILENHAKDEAKTDRQNKVNELRKGSGPLCDSGNISGKGSRPENLGQISSSVVTGRKRSIRLEGEYTKESRKGSRKGSSIWTLKGSERQELYNLIDAKLKSEGHPWDYVYTVTGKDYEDSAYSAFAEMPENRDWINGLILEVTRGRQGSVPNHRKGSRKGATSVDGKSPMEYLEMLYDLQGFPSQKDVISHGSETDAEEYLRNNASFYGIEYEKYLRTIFEEYEG